LRPERDAALSSRGLIPGPAAKELPKETYELPGEITGPKISRPAVTMSRTTL
jgi:hypothetical protein